jgi:hypothetical protein
MSDLAAFQDAFSAALLDPESSTPGGLAAQPGFAVYRNTVTKGCIDALQANYPSVARLVGDDWFRAAALVHVRAEPPRSPVLLDYGAGFARFLETFAPADELPYLPDVARLDRFWSEAHVAADDPVLPPAALSALAPEQLESARLRPHAAARWQQFDAQPIFTIWQRNRNADDDQSEIEWLGEAALITRPHGAVEARRIDAATCAFLDASAAGKTLAGAALAALDVDPQADLAQLMALLLEAGAFSELQHTESRQEETKP